MSIIGDGVDILKLVDKGHNAPLYKQIGEWIDKVAELQKSNETLKDEVLELRSKLRFKGQLQRISGSTFVDGDDEEICPRCAEVDLRLVHLISMHNAKPPFQKATCPQCGMFTMRGRPLNRQELIAKQGGS